MDEEQGARFLLAVHLQSEVAAENAFEAYFAAQRGELSRSRLLTRAAIRAHRLHLQKAGGGGRDGDASRSTPSETPR